MSFTNPGAAAMLNAFFRGASASSVISLSRSGNLFLGLSSSANPGQGGTPAAASEVPNAGSYNRVQITNNNSFAVATAGQISTISNQVVFNFPTATGSWGTVAGAFIATNGTPGGGTVLFVFSGMTPRTINANDSLSIPIGDLIATLD